MKKLVALTLAVLFLAPAMLAGQSLAELKTAYDAAIKTAVAAPNDYAANWNAAKASRKYGDKLVVLEAEGWKELAKAAARNGMRHGEIAQRIDPKGIEGWYWYGLCVGTYADCVSIVTALAEGLKGKTQKGFEMSYNVNKMYDNGGPMLSLGRFWQVLPGIAGKDLKKAEQLLTEYIVLFGTAKDPNEDAWYFRGSLYKDQGKIPEARADLQKAASLGQKDAAKLLTEIK